MVPYVDVVGAIFRNLKIETTIGIPVARIIVVPDLFGFAFLPDNDVGIERRAELSGKDPSTKFLTLFSRKAEPVLILLLGKNS